MLLPIVLAITLTTVAALLVLLVALLRHLKLLAASVATFGRDVQPLLEDIQRQSADAQERLDRLSQRGPDSKFPQRPSVSGASGEADT